MPALNEAFPNTKHCILSYPFFRWSFPTWGNALGRFHVGEWYCEKKGGNQNQKEATVISLRHYQVQRVHMKLDLEADS